MEVSIIFKIAAVGILVSVLSQVLKHSGREEQAFLVSLSGSAAYSLCRNLPGKKGGSFQTTAVHTSDFYCGSAGFLRNWPE